MLKLNSNEIDVGIIFFCAFDWQNNRIHFILYLKSKQNISTMHSSSPLLEFLKHVYEVVSALINWFTKKMNSLDLIK